MQKSRDLIARLGLNSRVTFAVANGLDALDVLQNEHPDTVFILGMGGNTVSGIIRRGANKLNGAALILGAQTDLPMVRQTLCDIGYRICHEVIASEGKHDYVLIRAEVGQISYTEEELLLGPVLLQEMPQNWLPMLERRMTLLHKGLQAMRASKLDKDAARLALFERESSYIQQVMDNLRKE